MEENIGVLLHKLTKYQTLLNNTSVHGKTDIYSQKINSYSQKLNKIGVNQNNINQLGGLIGGIDPTLQARLDAAKKKKEDASASLIRPDGNINSKVQAIGSRFADSITKLKGDIEKNTSEIQRLTSDNEAKIKQIEQLETNKQDLTKERDSLIEEKTLLERIADESITEFEDLTQKFVQYKKSVEDYTGETTQANERSLDDLLRIGEDIRESSGERTTEPVTVANKVYASLTGEEKPAAEQPAAEQPAAEKPAAEQPAAEQPAAKQQPVELPKEEPLLEEPPLEV